MMKFDINDMQNFDFNKSMKYLIFLSFVMQWSILSMIINLFTLGIFRLLLFLIMIIDALTMIKFTEKNIKRPSIILAKIWDVIDYITNRNNGHNYNTHYNTNSNNTIHKISDKIRSASYKIENVFRNFKNDKINRNKYKKERELNKFNKEIGKKITIEYTSDKNKLKKKSFDYKDRAITYIKVLESKGYKDYTKYNLDPNNSLSYIIFNKNKDIVNVFENKIQIKHDDKDYKYIIEGWPKK